MATNVEIQSLLNRIDVLDGTRDGYFEHYGLTYLAACVVANEVKGVVDARSLFIMTDGQTVSIDCDKDYQALLALTTASEKLSNAVKFYHRPKSADPKTLSQVSADDLFGSYLLMIALGQFLAGTASLHAHTVYGVMSFLGNKKIYSGVFQDFYRDDLATNKVTVPEGFVVPQTTAEYSALMVKLGEKYEFDAKAFKA